MVETEANGQADTLDVVQGTRQDAASGNLPRRRLVMAPPMILDNLTSPCSTRDQDGRNPVADIDARH